MFASVLQLILLSALQLQGAVVRLPVPPSIVLPPLPLTFRDAVELGWTRHAEHVAPRVTAKAALVVDPETGAVLFARKPGSRVAIASLTKLMTALVVLDEAKDLDRMVVIPPDANSIEGTRSWLVVGDSYSVRDLLSACIIPSAADGSLALASAFGGETRDGFVAKMNDRARKMGLSASFTNPVGMDAPDNYGTAADVASLLVELWRNPIAKPFLSMKTREVTSARGRKTLLESTDDLLGVDGITILAGKTGTTDEAGQNFAMIGSAEGGRTLLTVVLHSTNRYKDTKTLLAWSALAWSSPTN